MWKIRSEQQFYQEFKISKKREKRVWKKKKKKWISTSFIKNHKKRITNVDWKWKCHNERATGLQQQCCVNITRTIPIKSKHTRDNWSSLLCLLRILLNKKYKKSLHDEIKYWVDFLECWMLLECHYCSRRSPKLNSSEQERTTKQKTEREEKNFKNAALHQ